MASRKSGAGLYVAGGFLAGMAVGWLTAPRRGDWVRNQMQQKLEHWRAVGWRGSQKRARDLENRVRGKVAEVRNAMAGREHYVDANTLADQVHSLLGREFHRQFETANLNAVNHTIVLHGYVHSEVERLRLIEAIRGVEGVEDVQAAELRIVPPEEERTAG